MARHERGWEGALLPERIDRRAGIRKPRGHKRIYIRIERAQRRPLHASAPNRNKASSCILRRDHRSDGDDVCIDRRLDPRNDAQLVIVGCHAVTLIGGDVRREGR